jgi:hypothetical protein
LDQTNWVSVDQSANLTRDNAGDRPAGVDAQNWISISEEMGFVVTSSQWLAPTPDKQALLLTRPAEGYFMVHTGNVWQRLTIKDPLKGPGSTGRIAVINESRGMH